MAGLEPAAMGGAHLALPSSELHDHINCFRVGETHAQLRSECGSYIVRARSLTKLATSTPDQECDCLANPVANFIDNIILVRIHVDFSPLRTTFLWRISTKFNYQINLHIGGSGLNWTGAHGASIRCSTDWATEPRRGPNLTRTGDIEINSLSF